MSNLSKVSLIKCPDYSKDKVREAIDKTFSNFGGIENIIRKGSKVLIKPNFLKECDPESCTITHPSLIEIITEKVIDAGAYPVIGDSPAFGSVKSIAKRIGLDKFAEKLGVEIIELDKPRKIKINCVGREFTLTVSSKALDVDAIINVPKLKAHVQLLYTAGVKNLFGCVSGKTKVWRHVQSKDNLDWFSDMLMANYQVVKPVFTVLDAIMAMEKRGPSGGVPKKVSLIIGGNDAVAIDRVMAELLSINPEDVPILRAAKRLKIGELDLSKIEITGEELYSVRVPDFILPEIVPISFTSIRAAKSLIKHLWLKYCGKTATQA